jgi:site-specific recombinase XerD
MSTSISVICYRSKTLANSENPLMLRISKDGLKKYQSLGVSINPLNWDFKKKCLKMTCPNFNLIQKIILDKMTEVQIQVLELHALRKECTPTSLLKPLKSSITEKTVGDVYKRLILELSDSGNVGNRLIYKMSYNSLKTFSKGNLNLQFADIDVIWLMRYERWLRNKGNKETTISLLFRTLRSTFNKAIKENYTHNSAYPFNEFKISKFNTKTKKRAIAKQDMLKIMNVELSQDEDSISFARDIFVFSYLCAGINFTDIANLKSRNIIEGRLEYTRQKTHKEISILVSKEATRILSSYCQLSSTRGYLFPILDKQVHKSAIQKQNRIRKILGRVDKDLKIIAKKCEINANLTTYVARHSFSTVLKNSGVNVALISEALGHSDIAVTQIYLDSFDNKQVDEALINLL